MEGFERTLGFNRLVRQPLELEEGRRKRQNLVCTSIVASAVYACLHGSNKMRFGDWRVTVANMVRVLLSSCFPAWLSTLARWLVRAAAIVAVDLKDPSEFELCMDMFKSLIRDFSLDIALRG